MSTKTLQAAAAHILPARSSSSVLSRELYPFCLSHTYIHAGMGQIGPIPHCTEANCVSGTHSSAVNAHHSVKLYGFPTINVMCNTETILVKKNSTPQPNIN